MKTTIYKRAMSYLGMVSLSLALTVSLPLMGQFPTSPDFGDAPDGVIAYPHLGIIGSFPTCGGWGGGGIIHFDVYGGAFLSALDGRDHEWDGNAGWCPVFHPDGYDRDECQYDGDAGLMAPTAYTIKGEMNEEYVSICPEVTVHTDLGWACGEAYWGPHIDILISNPTPDIYYLNVIIDWDQDGGWGGSSSCVFEDAPEHVLVDYPIQPWFSGFLSEHPLPPTKFRVGPNSGWVWARFSIMERPVISVQFPWVTWHGDGEFFFGETEDYLLFVSGTDFGDAPHPYPTTMAQNGAMHRISPLYFGNMYPDNEIDGQPCYEAMGDDMNGYNDEDGIVFLNEFIPGEAAQIQITVNGMYDFISFDPPVYINAWIDWNKNGSWADPGEHVITSFPVTSTGTAVWGIMVPPYVTPGTTYARFRISSEPNLYFTGYAPDGEVEDYMIIIHGPPVLDFGDAPDGAPAYPATGVIGQFPTCMSVDSTGYIQHSIGQAYFGFSVDSEFDGNAGFCPSFYPDMYNQDECYNDGDAGLLYPTAFTITGPPGAQTVVPCPGSQGMVRPLGDVCSHIHWGPDIDIVVRNYSNHICYVNVLIDWNQDGKWEGESSCQGMLPSPEHVLVNLPVPIGFYGPLSVLPFAPPNYPFIVTGIKPGYVWARFTISEQQVPQNWDGSGIFENGETEDYLFLVTGGYDFGDAPDGPYPTLAANNGPRHLIDGVTYLGYSVDAELDGQPCPNAQGDDNDGNNDDDGVIFFPHLQVGQHHPVMVVASVPGYLNAWIDFNINGFWGDPEDHVFIDYPLMAGENHLVFFVPNGSVPGQSFARFRFASYPGLTFMGYASDGEVEDYEVFISDETPVELDLKLFLEGPFNGTDMNTDLNFSNVIPLSQPYDSDPSAVWYYTGAEQVATIPNSDVVDWILVELRDAGTAEGANKSTMVAQQACFLIKSGIVVALDGFSYPSFNVTVTNNLYVVIYHRNHLGIMSAIPLMPSGHLYSYDYSAGVGQVYGTVNGHKHLGGGVWGMIAGDGKSDGQINNGDKNEVWLPEAGSSGYNSGDFNMDLQVNNGDKNEIWVPNVGKGSLIP